MTEWSYQMFVFFVAHLIAMSSTVYNPFVYAWFNDTFRAQFRKVVPCCRRGAGRGGGGAGRRRCDVDVSPSRFATGGGVGWSSTTDTNHAVPPPSLDQQLPARTDDAPPPPPIELADLGDDASSAADKPNERT